MGGCRCTYKNCSSRSDGVIHMFHYPVFEKIRCHQWLLNAQKLEFLNLKVSQLKNRVVCQHHFRDDNFMNFLKDKLTFDAVPTLDGPNCDSSLLPTETESKQYNIVLEDIENEYLTMNDKRANFSVKYGDFLTNCDLTDLDLINRNDKNRQLVQIKDESEVKTLHNRLYPQINDNTVGNTITNKSSLSNNNIEIVIEPKNSNVLTLEMPVLNEPANSKYNLRPPKQVSEQNTTNFPKNKKITILEEKNLNGQLLPELSLPIKLGQISASSVLTLPNKKRKNNFNVSNQYYVVPVENTPKSDNNIQHQIHPEVIMDNSKFINVSENLEILNGQVCNENVEKNVENIATASQDTSSIPIGGDKVKRSNSILKTKIPPERAAAIEEKRKFNMKLRDIIAECLDKLDENEGDHYDKSSNSKIKKQITNKVSSYLAKDPELPNIQDYAVAYLEDRMYKMEARLINRIHQNTQKIGEIKNMVESSHTKKQTKKSAHTQTCTNTEEERKKQLYHEISQYLSTEANSLIYEELFINKHVDKTKWAPKKKRKY